MDAPEDAIQQKTELDGVDIPNLPIKEAERRAGWRKLPQKIRIAIRRLHRQFGHVPQRVCRTFLGQHVLAKNTLVQLSIFRCVECEESAPRRSAHKTLLPKRYEFKHALSNY